VHRALAPDETALIRAQTGAQVAYFLGITLATPDDRKRLLNRLCEFRKAAARSSSIPTCGQVYGGIGGNGLGRDAGRRCERDGPAELQG
jgi:hypothetical protein